MASKIVIEGDKRLMGAIDLQGAKNSVLPILAATILGNSPSVIHNCPNLTDVDAAIEILHNFGCRIKREDHAVWVDPPVWTRRRSIWISCARCAPRSFFLGAVLGRLGRAKLSFRAAASWGTGHRPASSRA
jgi:UDP-N-acetylglucosamine 1-carboxyvinyltransferase